MSKADYYRDVMDFEKEMEQLLKNELRFNYDSVYLEDNQDFARGRGRPLTSITEEQAWAMLDCGTYDNIAVFLGVSYSTAINIFKSIFPHAQSCRYNPKGRTKHAVNQATSRFHEIQTRIIPNILAGRERRAKQSKRSK